MTHRAFIAIGSNLGSPRDNCEKAINLICAHPECRLTASSSLYNTEPVGMEGADWFVNAVIEIQTSLDPFLLLRLLFSIEKKMGRVKAEKLSPRKIDLDILFYDDIILDSPELEIPHPGIPNRGFVLVPLKEIAGEYIHPKENKTISNLLQELKDDKEVKLIPPSI